MYMENLAVDEKQCPPFVNVLEGGVPLFVICPKMNQYYNRVRIQLPRIMGIAKGPFTIRASNTTLVLVVVLRLNSENELLRVLFYGVKN